MPRRRFSDRYNLPGGAANAMDMAEQQRRAAFGIRTLNTDPLLTEARQAQIDRAQAADAKARYELTKQIETDRQRTAFYNGLQELESHLNKNGAPLGSRQHQEAFAAYAHEFPLARSSTDVQNTLKLHSIVNDEQAALKERMKALLPPPNESVQRHAKLQGDIAQFQNVPEKENELNAALVESDVLENKFPKLKIPELPTQVITPDEEVVAPTTEVPQPTATPTPTAAALRYNPATGEYE